MLKELLNMMTISVTQLNEYAGRLIAGDEMLQGLLVEGEFQFKAHSSGHGIYAKDAQSSVRCYVSAIQSQREFSAGGRHEGDHRRRQFIFEMALQLYADHGQQAWVCSMKNMRR
ncbi:MAG: exodeoxyribonuclease VII large subunit [Christensenellales bacterium]